jgi:HEAT repeat protein
MKVICVLHVIAVTKERVLAVLYPDEPNYSEAAKLGSDALPHLANLVKSDDISLAAKAAALASHIQDEESVDILRSAAQSKHPLVRVVAALASQNLRVKGVNSILELLLDDRDESIRRHAVKSLNIIRDRSQIE